MYKKMVISLSLLTIAPAFASEQEPKPQERADRLYAIVVDLRITHNARRTMAQELKDKGLVGLLTQEQQRKFQAVAIDLGLAQPAKKVVPTIEDKNVSQIAPEKAPERRGHYELNAAGDRDVWVPDYQPAQPSYQDLANAGYYPC